MNFQELILVDENFDVLNQSESFDNINEEYQKVTVIYTT